MHESSMARDDSATNAGDFYSARLGSASAHQKFPGCAFVTVIGPMINRGTVWKVNKAMVRHRPVRDAIIFL